MPTDTHAEPLHQRILVPLGASIAMSAAVLAAAAIALAVTAPADLSLAVAEGGAMSLLRAIAAVVMELFWSMVQFL